jgi:hypothetical protein
VLSWDSFDQQRGSMPLPEASKGISRRGFGMIGYYGCVYLGHDIFRRVWPGSVLPTG